MALRRLTGDELLVRIGNRMELTERAGMLAIPTKRILADLAFLQGQSEAHSPGQWAQSFRIGTYDFLPDSFFATLAQRVMSETPECNLVIRGLGSRFEHYRQLADGDLDMIVTVWPELPEHLRSISLGLEPLVCLLRRGHPLSAEGALTLTGLRNAQQLSSLEQIAGHGTIIDNHLAQLGLTMKTRVQTQFLGLTPEIVARTDLVFTTGLSLAHSFAKRADLVIRPFPAKARSLQYRLVWHERTHHHRALQWLREEVVSAWRTLKQDRSLAHP